MDLTFPAVVERAARTAREFVESYLLSAAESRRSRPEGIAGLGPVVATSPLAHFAVFRELGRVPAPWAETFGAAGLRLHDVHEAPGVTALALGDPRRRPDRDALGVSATRRGDAWALHGVALVPAYLTPFDALLVAAGLSTEQDVGVFLLAARPRAAGEGPAGLRHVTLDGSAGRLLERGEPAWQHLLALRRRERLSQIALAVGAASHAHAASLAAVREATAAKDPLALGQGIQFQIADDAIDLQAAEALALHCATLAEAGALGAADLALTRFMVLEAFERIGLRAAHVTGLFAPGAPAWSRVFLDLARGLKLAGGAVELDRRDAALGLLQSA